MEIESHELYGEFDEAEAVVRLPELDDIGDDELREQAISAVQSMPDYFWTAAASSKYHPPEHRVRHGLWLHTKRVVTAFERTADSMVKQGHLSKYDVDMGRVACLLHDMFKYGEPPTPVQSTVRDHDVIAARWVREATDLPDAVGGAVEAHNGPWYHGKNPSTHLEQMVHVADMTASDPNVHIAVKDMHPILEEQFPRVDER